MNTNQLKAKILDLAIRGKLVPQNPSDGNAADFLKKLHNISDNEIPFQIPENWCWCRLGQIADIERGGSPRPIADYLTTNDDGINWIKIGDTKKGDKYIVSVKEKIKPEGIRYSRLVHAGDFLLTNSMSFGRPYILKVDGCIHDGWLVFGNIDSCISPEFLFQLLSSPFIYQSFKLTAAGSTVNNLNIDRVKQVIFPLPPLSEQQRIVSAIEKIFEQIDIIETNKFNLKKIIKQTKNKVLDLAIHGKLVEQILQEGNATDLLQKVRDEKTDLLKQKKLKEDKKSSFIIKSEDGKHYEHFADGTLKYIEEEIPFEIPENWCWCRLPEISNSILAGGDRPSICTKEKTSENVVPIYANAVEKEGLYGFTNKPQVTEKAITISARGTIGFTCIREEPFVPIVRLIVLVPNLSIIQLKYLKSTFDTLLNMTEGSSIPQLTIPSIKTFLFPLPPVEEQKRIVERIEQIFEQLDVLEKALGE